MGRQQKHLKELAPLLVMVFGALSIIITGCDGGDDRDDDNAATITQQTLVATWDIAASNPQGYTQNGTISLNDDGTLAYELVQINKNVPAQRPMVLIGTGTWTFDRTSLTMTFDSGIVYQGTTQGDSTTFSIICSNGWTLDFDLL